MPGFSAKEAALVVACLCLLCVPPCRAAQQSHALIRNAGARPCSDNDLLLFRDRRTHGPLPDEAALSENPDCRFDPSDVSVPELGVSDGDMGNPVSMVSLSGALQQSFEQSSNILANSNANGPYFLMISVFKVHAKWCKPPCQSMTWENAATKATKGNGNYQLLEACIWDAEKRIVLYEFDPEWHKIAKNAPHGICKGKGFSCQAYYDHREKAKLFEARWTDAIKDQALSSWMKEQMKAVFRIAKSRRALNYGLTYSGHGARANGALFEGILYKADAQTLLKDEVDRKGKRFALFNFGGNCAEGKWNMVKALSPYADYLVASDLLVTGVRSLPSSKVKEYLGLKKKYDDLSYVKELFEKRMTTLQAAKELLAGRRKIWKFAKDAIKIDKLKQSKSLYDCCKHPGQALVRRRSSW
jgi:hypothetical protein